MGDPLEDIDVMLANEDNFKAIMKDGKGLQEYFIVLLGFIFSGTLTNLHLTQKKE